jgi:hypothetical protein
MSEPLELRLVRDKAGAHSTLGTLYVDGRRFCETLEDTLRERPGVPVAEWKIAGHTAIPRGRYRVVIDDSARFGRPMLHLLDVPGFTGIRVHGANTDRDVRGCIGVGAVRRGDGIALCADVLARLEKTVAQALAAGREVWMEVL